ncbi:MAG: DUF433 domain-containing protein [Candidatus Brocadiaceae bacterium]|nr:DUF433 domain-containing protein [Candidatus Brocadiaceae bacterium]
MSTIQKSLRLPGELVKELESITNDSGKDFSTVTKELLHEAIKMRRCPGIVFTEGVRGHRARIAGTGIEVWEIITTYHNINKSLKRLQKTYHWLTEQQLRSAIGYWKSYPDEIDALVTQNENWTEEHINEKYPFLTRISI